jgi:hypothetical protein
MTVTTSSFVQHNHFCPVNHASIFSRNSYKTKISRKSYIGNFWQIQGSIRILYRGFQKKFCIGGHAPVHLSLRPWPQLSLDQVTLRWSIPFTRYPPKRTTHRAFHSLGTPKGTTYPTYPTSDVQCLNGMHLIFHVWPCRGPPTIPCIHVFHRYFLKKDATLESPITLAWRVIYYNGWIDYIKLHILFLHGLLFTLCEIVYLTTSVSRKRRPRFTSFLFEQELF